MPGSVHKRAMTSWIQKRRARRRLKSTTAIWYHVEYKARCLARTARVAELHLDRAERMLGRLWAEGVIGSQDVRPAPMASLRDLHRVHPTKYLRSLLDRTILASVFGLESSDIDVDDVLTAQRYAVGGTIAAAEWAADGRGRVGFNLGGGFHHAEPESGSGFCVYNDIAVAIARLRGQGYDKPIAIIDLDFHQGNGNIVTFADDPSVWTFSIHGSAWGEFEAKSDHQVMLPGGTGDEAYLAALQQELPSLLKQQEPGLVFYIAGTDVLAGDALGLFALTPEGVLARDRFVLDTAASVDASVVVTLGGGYSETAWQTTANLLRYALTDSTEVVVSSEEEDLRKQFEQIAETISPQQLQRDSGSWQFSEAGVLEDLQGGRHRARRILDFYSAQGVELALEEYGLLDKVRAMGFSQIRVSIDAADREHQRLTVHGKKGLGPFHQLVDLVVQKESLRVPQAAGLEGGVDLLSVKWLQLQDPTARFSVHRPKLPGQDHPGLGLVQEVMLLLFQACVRLKLDGIVFHPSRYHIAVLGVKHCFFLDPAVQGRFDALREALGSHDLASASVLLHSDRVVRGDGTVVEWEPAHYVAPVSERLVEYFRSKAYVGARVAAHNQMQASKVLVQDSPPAISAPVKDQPHPT